MEYLAGLDWTAISSQFTAVVIALYGVSKAMVKLIGLFRKKDGV